MEEKLIPDQIPVAQLAYLGDCVYELYIREMLVSHNVQRPSIAALEYVTAHMQNRVVTRILPLLTEEEETQYRRGRNLGHTGVPKTASPSEYRRATGLEALLGWLYLRGREDRVRELISTGIAPPEKRTEEGT